jgi:hypothetical protein
MFFALVLPSPSREVLQRLVWFALLAPSANVWMVWDSWFQDSTHLMIPGVLATAILSFDCWQNLNAYIVASALCPLFCLIKLTCVFWHTCTRPCVSLHPIDPTLVLPRNVASKPCRCVKREPTRHSSNIDYTLCQFASNRSFFWNMASKCQKRTNKAFQQHRLHTVSVCIQ